MSEIQLKSKYQIYYSSGIENRKNMTKEDFQSQLQPLVAFQTDEEFWRIFLHLKLPTALQLKSKIFIFKENILPIWEHPENKEGGRIYIKLPLNRECDEIWQNLVLEFLTGFNNNDYLNNDVNGIELSVRQVDLACIAIWTNHNDFRNVKDLFYHLKRNVPFPKFVELDFSEHPKKFFHTGGPGNRADT